MWFLYQLAFLLALVIAAPMLLGRRMLRRGRRGLETLPARLGRLPEARGVRPLWLHAASVGEASVGATFAASLPPDLDLLVTTITPTGQAAAKRLFGPLRSERRSVVVTCCPFDLGPLVNRFLGRFGPRVLVLLENELWPLLLSRCEQRGIPVVVLNGRVSDRGFARLGRFGALARRVLLDPVSRFGVQSAQDEERLLSLGVPSAKVVLTGNLKFDTDEPAPLPDLEASLRRLAAGRPVIVAGSTMVGEEALVLDAFEGMERDAMLVLAPRHPERFDDAWREVCERSLPAERRSAWAASSCVRAGETADGSRAPGCPAGAGSPTSGAPGPGPAPAGSAPAVPVGEGRPGAAERRRERGRKRAGPRRVGELVQALRPEALGAEAVVAPAGETAASREGEARVRVVLLDSLGELASVYRLAAVAFIGGSLVPAGGHNPIEAARFGVPVTVGPSMENFRSMADDFVTAGGLTVVPDGDALAAAWRRLLDHPDEAAEQGRAGRELVDRNRGAVERSHRLLAELVELA